MADIMRASEAFHLVSQSKFIKDDETVKQHNEFVKIKRNVNDKIAEVAKDGKTSIAFVNPIAEYGAEIFIRLFKEFVFRDYDVRFDLTFKDGAYRSFNWKWAYDNDVFSEFSVYDVDRSEMIVSWGED